MRLSWRSGVLGVALALQLIIAYRTYNDLKLFQRNSDSIQRTLQVLATTEDLISTVKDAETGQRGYLLTNQEAYLEPYRTALARLNVIENRLRELLSDPAQLSRMQR